MHRTVHRLAKQRSWVLTVGPYVFWKNLRQVVHTRASVTKQYNLVPIRGQRRSTAGKVTALATRHRFQWLMGWRLMGGRWLTFSRGMTHFAFSLLTITRIIKFLKKIICNNIHEIIISTLTVLGLMNINFALFSKWRIRVVLSCVILRLLRSNVCTGARHEESDESTKTRSWLMSCASNEKPNMNEICREDSFLLQN